MKNDFERMKWALNELRDQNRLKNDFDVYLFAVADYGINHIDDELPFNEANKPNPGDYGL